MARALKELRNDDGRPSNTLLKRAERDRGSKANLHGAKMLVNFKNIYGDLLSAQSRGKQRQINKGFKRRKVEVVFENA